MTEFISLMHSSPRHCPGMETAAFKYSKWGTLLVVQGLRLCASNARGAGLTSGRGTRIPCAPWCCKKITVSGKDPFATHPNMTTTVMNDTEIPKVLKMKIKGKEM